MSVIGTFKVTGNEFTGDIATLTIQSRNVRFISAERTSDAGPAYRIYPGPAEIGAAWTKRSKENKPYLSVLLDDPSMMAPFDASLVFGEEGGDHSLIWSRGSRRNQD